MSGLLDLLLFAAYLLAVLACFAFAVSGVVATVTTCLALQDRLDQRRRKRRAATPEEPHRRHPDIPREDQ